MLGCGGLEHHNSITVLNYYNPCKPLILSDVDDIMEKVKCPVIWVGDFNEFQECAQSLIGEADSEDSVDNWNAAKPLAS